MPASPNNAIVIGTPTKSVEAPEKQAVKTPFTSSFTHPAFTISKETA